MTSSDNEIMASGRSLRVEDLTAYLGRRGWKREAHPNQRLLVFVGPADDHGKPLHIIIPRSNDFEDAAQRVSDAVSLLALIEKRHTFDIVQAIKALDKDLLRLRLVTGPGQSDSLSFELATKLVQGLRNLLSYAACHGGNPKPYFVKASGIGRRYVEKCRFGQTFSGSFGLTIESPVVPSAQQPIGGTTAPSPFERRVMARLVRGLALTQEVLLSGDVSPLIINYSKGLNANMCEAILEMPRELRDMEMQYSVLWSPELKAPADVAEDVPIRFEPKSYEYLETAARMLRHVEQSSDVEVRGRVVQLRSEVAPSDEEDDDVGAERIVTVLREQEGTDQIRVRILLDPEQYKSACDAHKEGRIVSVIGKLEKLGKFWTLMSPRDFRVLS